MSSLTFCFDELYRSGDSVTLRISDENQQRPVFYYWIGMFCFMAPEKMNAVAAAEVDDVAEHFVYVFEMNWNMREWSNTMPGKSIVVLPESVRRATKERRAIVLVSFAHEGRPHYLGSGIRGETTLLELQHRNAGNEGVELCVFDKLAELAEFYDLLPEQLWFVTGDMLAEEEELAWRAERLLHESPFTLRICELSSFAVGLTTRESALRSRGPHGVPVSGNDRDQLANWQQLKVRWIDRPLSAYRHGEVWDEPRWRFACMNRRFRRHRWWVVERLYREGLLAHGCVSFPASNVLDLAAAAIELRPPGSLSLLEDLPLELDMSLAHVARTRNFFAENTHTVSSSPEVVTRGSALEIVTETYYSGGRFVSEKTFKALLDRGPAAIVGSRGTLDYLRSIGVETWSEVLDESYDQVGDTVTDDDDQRRFEAVMGAVLPTLHDSSESRKLAHACRRQHEHNLRWLVEADKPWDRLLAEINSTLVQL